MATLPNGTEVSRQITEPWGVAPPNDLTLQITEPWGVAPPNDLTLQITEPWGSTPPAVRGIEASGPSKTLETGKTATISGTVTDGDSNGAGGEAVEVTITSPDGSETTLTATTDATGAFAVETSGLEQSGEYSATAFVSGLESRITEDWE